MTPSEYTEDALVERPAIGLMETLGWESVNAYHEFDHGKSILGRETRADVILISHLRQSLHKLNPDLQSDAFDQAIEILTKDRSRMSMVAANKEFYKLLKHGIRVNVAGPEDADESIEVVRLIDWQNPENNNYLICSQFWVTGEMYTRRADLVGFINGIPLILFELKATHRRLETAFSGNISDYKDTIPQLFWPNAFIILSNGSQSRIGSITSGWEHFNEWKKVESEQDEPRISLETMLRGLCEPTRLLDYIENFTLFQEVPGGLIKLIGKNHQYLGVNNAIIALENISDCHGKLGVFWHTQGSGKSISMIFFSQKVLRNIPGNWTFVIVTDRQELDGQIYKNFVSTGVITEGHAQATSSRHLRQLLREDHRYVFTLIHKFRTEVGEEHPVLSERDNIIVITDEAHRSQYDTLAMNMRTALPNAAFLAFTGTPLIAGEEKTRQVFGEYISVYDFKQSVDDGATVPLYYENRIPELQLVNENLNEDMGRLLEETELDEDQEKKLEREFAREYHLITRDDRLEAIAKDLVSHFTGRGFRGKAMMVCIDKATAVKMYDKVKKHWEDHISVLQAELLTANDEAKRELEEKITWMQQTDMAVVVSQGQNEIAEMAAKGLDIKPHRRRMEKEDMETKFKNPDDPFRLVFVCAMWMTGFDVPSCSTLYLDKPMRNHTLMQTIARANRVYEGKVSGLIVDYVGVFRNLEKALAIYGAGKGGDNPVEDKAELIAALDDALAEAINFIEDRGISMDNILSAKGFELVAMLDDAVDSLVATDDVKRRYITHANTVQRLYKAILPDQKAMEFSLKVRPLKIIADKIHNLTPPADISIIMDQVDELLDDSVSAEGYIIRDDPPGNYTDHLIDLSNIDFDTLAERFRSGRKRTINEKLKGSIARKLMIMVRQNRTRMDYMEKFQKMIEEYNSGSHNVEEFFRRLTEFARGLNHEEQRAVSENMNEEELALFDLLTKPEIELSAGESQKVKTAARDLLNTLKTEKLVLDWRKRQQARAEVRVTIEKLLDQGLPGAYTPELFEQKTAAIFQHIYDSYYGAGRSVYAVA
ncbi:MAG: type I restriction endonuclease subunit R [Deltaproteobacteria bacterium]|nr:type I restriction endonuclease subunit R [Deltaproteobacteria bacterium]